MSRFALAGLRLLAALAAGAAAWTTLWVIRGGEPGPAAYVASLIATLAVYIASATPAPKSWEPEPAGPDPDRPPDGAEASEPAK